LTRALQRLGQALEDFNSLCDDSKLPEKQQGGLNAQLHVLAGLLDKAKSTAAHEIDQYNGRTRAGEVETTDWVIIFRTEWRKYMRLQSFRNSTRTSPRACIIASCYSALSMVA
jgi:hypothetical protein